MNRSLYLMPAALLAIPAIASAHSGRAEITCADPLSPTPELVLHVTTNVDFGGTSATFRPTIYVNGVLVTVIPPEFTAAVHNKVVDPIADFRVPVPGGVVLDTTGSSIPFVNGTFRSSLALPVYRGVCGVAPPPPSPAPPPVMPNISEPPAAETTSANPAPAPAAPKPEATPHKRPTVRPKPKPRPAPRPKLRRCNPGTVRVVIYAWVGKAPRRHIIPVHANCIGRVPAPPVTG